MCRNGQRHAFDSRGDARGDRHLRSIGQHQTIEIEDRNVSRREVAVQDRPYARQFTGSVQTRNVAE